MGYPIKIRGVTYESMAEASSKLGVKQGVIRAALDRGDIDSVGLEDGTISRTRITFDGIEYLSVRLLLEANDWMAKKSIYRNVAQAKRHNVRWFKYKGKYFTFKCSGEW